MNKQGAEAIVKSVDNKRLVDKYASIKIFKGLVLAILSVSILFHPICALAGAFVIGWKGLDYIKEGFLYKEVIGEGD